MSVSKCLNNNLHEKQGSPFFKEINTDGIFVRVYHSLIWQEGKS